MFTSYYAKHGTDPRSISISAKAPPWYVGRTYPLLAPTWDIINGVKARRITEAQYTTQYMAILKERGVTPQRIINELDDSILLCYEVPSDFCHRHIVAAWIETELGIVVPELSLVKQPTLVDNIFTF